MWHLLLQAIDAPASLEEYNYFSTVHSRASLSRGMQLVVTKLLKELWSLVKEVIHGSVSMQTLPSQKGRGVWIEGPMGTGKTTALLYLHQKLKGKGFLVLKLSLHQMDGYREYLAKVSLVMGFHLLPYTNSISYLQ